MRLRLVAVLACGLILAGCGRELPDDAAPTTTLSEQEATGAFGDDELGALSGRIRIDGSSTLQPFAAAAAERFRRDEPGVRVSVGSSGTGGGFEKFCLGEIDIANASREIDDDERAACEEEGIRYLELHVANDGVAAIRSEANTWAECLTIDRLKAIWEPDSDVDSWRDVDPAFPDTRLRLAGPGTDSGTFDFFTEKVVGEDGASRSDYTQSENDNVIVEAVSGSPGGHGYLGLSYAEQNAARVKTIAVDAGEGCVEPSTEAVQNGSYALSRPLFMYVRENVVEESHVNAFLTDVLDDQAAIARKALFVPLTAAQLSRSRTIFEAGGLDVGDE